MAPFPSPLLVTCDEPVLLIRDSRHPPSLLVGCCQQAELPQDCKHSVFLVKRIIGATMRLKSQGGLSPVVFHFSHSWCWPHCPGNQVTQNDKFPGRAQVAPRSTQGQHSLQVVLPVLPTPNKMWSFWVLSFLGLALLQVLCPGFLVLLLLLVYFLFNFPQFLFFLILHTSCTLVFSVKGDEYVSC